MRANVGKYLQELSLGIDVYVSWDSYLPMDWDDTLLATDVMTSKVYTDVESFQDKVRPYGENMEKEQVVFKGLGV